MKPEARASAALLFSSRVLMNHTVMRLNGFGTHAPRRSALPPVGCSGGDRATISGAACNRAGMNIAA